LSCGSVLKVESGVSGMELHEEKVGEVTVVEVQGRVDSTTAPALGERLSALLGAARGRLLIDMSRLEYISSAGFRILLLAAKRADETGSRFVLCGVTGKVRQLFDLGGFLDLFTIVGSREEGVAAAR
jgi:anti-anti-sigma factor